jgi:hypothetical protein
VGSLDCGLKSPRWLAIAADAVAPISSIAAATSSIAFFKPWVEFSINGAEPGLIELSGSALANQIGGLASWLHLTPTALVVVLAASFSMLLTPRRSIRITCGPLLSAIALALIAWPMLSLLRMMRNMSWFQALGPTTMALTFWWWVYCGSLAVIFVSGIIELVITAWDHVKASAASKS